MTEKCECPIAAHEQRFKSVEDDVIELKGNVSELKTQVTNIDKEVAVKNTVFATAIENLSKLPDTLGSLKEAMLTIQSNNNVVAGDLSKVTQDVSDIRLKLDKVDEEGKFNIRLWIHDNWIVLIIGAGTVIDVGSRIVERFVK